MDLDTGIFFLIVVGGVVIIWSFRRTTKRTKDIKELEYLAFASIWGTLLVIAYSQLAKLLDVEALTQLLNNPLASALVFAVLGLLVGTIIGSIENKFQLSKLFKKWLNYL
jgi:uncharacterized membrane protein